MPASLILDRDFLTPVQGATLYYPCSGADFRMPIKLFAPAVTDFWFVDRGYFAPGHQDTEYAGLDAPADRQRPVLHGDRHYDLLATRVVGPPQWDWFDREIEPCVLTETYRHRATGREIRIHRRRGYGLSGLRKEVVSLGVFFYRGDSAGEGGSGHLWLRERQLDEICRKVIDGGYLVTDGSNAAGGKSGYAYDPLLALRHRERMPGSPDKLAALLGTLPAFHDRQGRQFRCVGYAGMRYGPTLIWQVRQPGSGHAAASLRLRPTDRPDH